MRAIILKNMRQISFILVVGMATLLSGCSNWKEQATQLQSRVDSLQNINSIQQQELASLNEFFGNIEESLDSINEQEQLLVLTTTDENGIPLKKQQILDNLDSYKNLLQRQHERLAELEKLPGQNAKLRKTIEFLREEIVKKDGEISDLQEKVSQKNADIQKLVGNIAQLKENVNKLEETDKVQKEAIATQDQMLNTGYFIIDTKKNLKDKGLLSGGFLKKKKIEFNNINESLFTAIDIRDFREITIQSEDVKILSSQPEDSYRLEEQDDDTTILTITDANRFWSVTNFLIIQIK